MDPELINNLTTDHYQKINDQMAQDLRDYYEKIQIPLSESDCSFLLPEQDQEKSPTLFIVEATEEQNIPLYCLSIRLVLLLVALWIRLFPMSRNLGLRWKDYKATCYPGNSRWDSGTYTSEIL